MPCTRCQIQTFTLQRSNRNQIRTRVKGHAGARGAFISLFITLKTEAVMKNKEAVKALGILLIYYSYFQTQQNNLSVTIADNHRKRNLDIRVFKHRKDRLSHKQILKIWRRTQLERERWSWGLITWVGWQGQVTGRSGEGHCGIS